MKKPSTALWGDLGILTCALLWGFSFGCLKVAGQAFSPLWIIALRFLGTLVILAALLPKRLMSLTRDDWKSGSAVGLSLTLGFLTQTIGVRYTSTGKIAFLMAGYVVLVPFLVWLLRRTRPHISAFMAAAVCLVGMALLSLDGSFSVGLGELWGILSAFTAVTQLLCVDFFARGRDPFKLSMVQAITGGGLSLLLALTTSPVPSQIPGDAWYAIGYLILFCTVIPYVLQFRAQPMTTPTHASIIFSLESVFAVLIGVLWFHEPFTNRMFWGCVLIFAAILITVLPWASGTSAKTDAAGSAP